MTDHPEETPAPDSDLNEVELEDLVGRVFNEEDFDWSETQSSARTVGDLRLMRNLYSVWKIYEFNRLVMEGEDPTDSLGSDR